MTVELEQIDNWFTYHPPFGDQPGAYELIRTAGKALASEICHLCPDSVERDAAVLRVREAVMLANAAIACNELEPQQT